MFVELTAPPPLPLILTVSALWGCKVIRNEALLVLIELTKDNVQIQKIVAFQNGFNMILDIIDEEGRSDGGIIVEDCFQLALSLLRNNESNQTFFKEMSCIERLVPFLSVRPQAMCTAHLASTTPVARS